MSAPQRPSSATLPADPSLRHLKLQARRLHDDWKAGDPKAIERIGSVLPRLRDTDPADIYGCDLKLREAQFIVAREYGFDSWSKLCGHVESLTGAASLQDTWTLDHGDALGAAHQRYASLFAACVSDVLATHVQVRSTDAQAVTHDAFLGTLEGGCCLYSFGVKPDTWPIDSISPVAVDLTIPLAGTILGQTSPTADTVFADRMRIVPVVRRLVFDFERIWDRQPAMRVGDARIVTGPDSPNLPQTSDTWVVASFEVRSTRIRTRFRICYPGRTLDTIIAPYLEGQRADFMQPPDSTSLGGVSLLFAGHRRGRLLINRILDGLDGSLLTDRATPPTAAQAMLEGDTYFAGDPSTDTVRQMLQTIRSVRLIPENDAWSDLILSTCDGRVERDRRIEFSPESLSASHLRRLAADIPPNVEIVRINADLESRIKRQLYPGIGDGYASLNAFLSEGIGYCAVQDGEPICCATTLFTHRGRSKINLEFESGKADHRIELATCASTVAACLDAGIEPHWRYVGDEDSLLGTLAQELGYAICEDYEVLVPHRG